jgi:hypothetical protein
VLLAADCLLVPVSTMSTRSSPSTRVPPFDDKIRAYRWGRDRTVGPPSDWKRFLGSQVSAMDGRLQGLLQRLVHQHSAFLSARVHPTFGTYHPQNFRVSAVPVEASTIFEEALPRGLDLTLPLLSFLLAAPRCIVARAQRHSTGFHCGHFLGCCRPGLPLICHLSAFVVGPSLIFPALLWASGWSQFEATVALSRQT